MFGKKVTVSMAIAISMALVLYILHEARHGRFRDRQTMDSVDIGELFKLRAIKNAEYVSDQIPAPPPPLSTGGTPSLPPAVPPAALASTIWQQVADLNASADKLCSSPHWPPELMAQSNEYPLWQHHSQIGCPVLSDAWSYHCTPASCMPRGKRVALLLGTPPFGDKLLPQQWDVLLSNADVWILGDDPIPHKDPLEVAESSSMIKALLAREPQIYSFNSCPYQSPPGSTIRVCMGNSAEPEVGENIRCHPMKDSEHCKRHQQACFREHVSRCSQYSHDIKGNWENCWEQWGHIYVNKNALCKNQTSELTLLEFLRTLKLFHYDEVFVAGDLSSQVLLPEEVNMQSDILSGLANAIAITASILGLKVTNLNIREQGKWLQETVFTLIRDRDLRCGSQDFGHILSSTWINAPIMLDTDPTTEMPYSPDNQHYWQVFDQIPDPTIMNLPRTQRRTCLVLGNGPSLNKSQKNKLPSNMINTLPG